MKKSIIAAAIAGALSTGAFAQNVTLAGLIDAYVGSIQYSGDKRTAVVNSGGMTTSWWGMSGEEKLGNGLTAEFKLTGFFRGDNGAFGRFGGDNTFSRDAWVGLKGDFGTVHFGRDLAPNFLPTVIFNAFGDSFAFSPLVLHANVPLFNGTGWAAANAGDTGWSNQIRYTTPNFGGFSANAHYQLGEVAGNSSKRNVGLNFLYFGGPFALGGFWHDVRLANPGGAVLTTTQKAWMLSGKGSFGGANVYANYERANNSNNNDSKTASLSADFAVGPGKVMAGWANTKWTGSSSKRDTFTVGYDYNFSKRTDGYVMLVNDKITNYDRGNSFAVGIRHRF